MSLDVWLSNEPETAETIAKKFFNLDTLETRNSDSLDFHEVAVWQIKDAIEAALASPPKAEMLWEWNITHNLNKMAMEAEIYQHLWRPSEVNVKKASDLVEPLTKGLFKLKADPEHFKKLNPENGWGEYTDLVAFVEEYIRACIEFPDASVNVCR